MIGVRRRVAVLLAICILGVAACTAVTPSPPPTGSVAAASPTAATPSEMFSPLPADSEPPAEGDLRAEIEVISVDPSATHPLLEFVSDGQSIVFSSGRADDSEPGAAPDLWRMVPPATEPELLWRNPERDHAIVKIAGDLGLIAFVEMPLSGERAWNLWLLPRGAEAPVLLDRHPGDEDVSSLVPSLAVSERTVAWTAFDRGEEGPVSQLLIAREPDWRPEPIHQLSAAAAEIWLPSLRGSELAFAEVHYSPDRSTDERRVYLTSAIPGAERRRLDDSGLATMPLVVDGAVLWKEADPGFNMFNWGRMFRYDLRTNQVSRLDTAPQPDVNYPSAGSRFVTWWGADSFWLTVYDLVRDEPRIVARNTHASQESEFEPHIAGDLIVWRHVAPLDPDDRGELRYAFLPPLREDR